MRNREVIDAVVKSGNLAATSALIRGDLGNALIAATPGGIEAQEAAGQRELVGERDLLPIKCPRKELESLGFIFGDNASNDPNEIFVSASFPLGWSKKATDHSMWSDLLDDKGRKRGAIFYKAAFYDRSSHMSLNRRFNVSGNDLDADGSKFDWNSGKSPALRQIGVVDSATGELVFGAGNVPYSDYRAADKKREEAKAWLREHYPCADDVLAYWD